MQSAGAVKVECEKRSPSGGKSQDAILAGTHGRVIARRPRGSKPVHSQLPALISQEDLNILSFQISIYTVSSTK